MPPGSIASSHWSALRRKPKSAHEASAAPRQETTRAQALDFRVPTLSV